MKMLTHINAPILSHKGRSVKVRKKIFEHLENNACFFWALCYYSQDEKNRKKDPGVAKFGIALEWGSRGPEFESQHSDQLSLKNRLNRRFFCISDNFF